MHALRTSSVIARLVLAWFALTLGAAIASPMVSPHAMELVCTTGGHVKLVALNDDGQQVSDEAYSLDCSLCLPLLATPPAEVKAVSAFNAPEQQAVPRLVQQHIPYGAGAPLPARGPPAAL
ncbi:hypothetical protein SDC9_147495 [bioreactor metagenome]|uniref:DUF2946 domain-containing protein n=1 Tax=bioreactor metagenome TaxID=1076179 RepID=A0A645EEH8_9ZZZZ